MSERDEAIKRLIQKQNLLVQWQKDISIEIDKLGKEIDRVAGSATEPVLRETPVVKSQVTIPPQEAAPRREPIPVPQATSRPQAALPPRRQRSDIEKFIGENLISKIGIAITVIGVAIGAKYSIEHELISPLTRIILGYLVGAGLLFIGMRLKAKYHHYSAVLVSGAIAVMYFMTYAAYDYYALIPQTIAFALMVVLTGFGVLAALRYDQQVIAIFGLAGAYAVPFLLSDGSGKVVVLFSYMSLINAGILVISIKKYWKIVHQIAFWLTWLIFTGWFIADYDPTKFPTASLFACIFFAIFYAAFLAYKSINKEAFLRADVLLILSNAFIFFGTGYALLTSLKGGEDFLGLFTVANALIHFVVAVALYRQKLADKNLFYLTAGLVLVFITIAIPVQLDGDWVTMLWAGEAALLFWIGRSKSVAFYERLSYALTILALISLAQDWGGAYDPWYASSQTFRPVCNMHLLTSLLFIASLGWINWVNLRHRRSEGVFNEGVMRVINNALPLILTGSIYMAFRLEISYYWSQLAGAFDKLQSAGTSSQGFRLMREIWIINYSLFFLAGLGLVNLWKLKNKPLAYLTLCASAFTLLVFNTGGLADLTFLHRLADTTLSGAAIFSGTILLRYISYLFAALNLYVCFRLIEKYLQKPVARKAFDLTTHITILAVLSAELVNILESAGALEAIKLSTTILLGAYSLLLIGVGLLRNKKHLRIAAIVLFGGTLLKLFLYDLSNLNTMSKTIVFIALGILLLLISFLYNKYRYLITDETKP